MADIFYQFARKIRPDLSALSGQRRLGGVADVISLFFSLPLLVVGLVWLVRASDWQAIIQHWGFVSLMALLIVVLNRLSFYVITEIRAGGYANSQGALDGIALWSAALIVGPVAIWLDVLWNLGSLLNGLRTAHTVGAYWSRFRLAVTTLAASTLSTLLGLQAYTFFGGRIQDCDETGVARCEAHAERACTSKTLDSQCHIAMRRRVAWNLQHGIPVAARVEYQGSVFAASVSE